MRIDALVARQAALHAGGGFRQAAAPRIVDPRHPTQRRRADGRGDGLGHLPTRTRVAADRGRRAVAGSTGVIITGGRVPVQRRQWLRAMTALAGLATVAPDRSRAAGTRDEEGGARPRLAPRAVRRSFPDRPARRRGGADARAPRDEGIVHRVRSALGGRLLRLCDRAPRRPAVPAVLPGLAPCRQGRQPGRGYLLRRVAAMGSDGPGPISGSSNARAAGRTASSSRTCRRSRTTSAR